MALVTEWEGLPRVHRLARLPEKAAEHSSRAQQRAQGMAQRPGGQATSMADTADCELAAHPLAQFLSQPQLLRHGGARAGVGQRLAALERAACPARRVLVL